LRDRTNENDREKGCIRGKVGVLGLHSPATPKLCPGDGGQEFLAWSLPHYKVPCAPNPVLAQDAVALRHPEPVAATPDRCPLWGRQMPGAPGNTPGRRGCRERQFSVRCSLLLLDSHAPPSYLETVSTPYHPLHTPTAMDCASPSLLLTPQAPSPLTPHSVPLVSWTPGTQRHGRQSGSAAGV
jgi:hypothetical protein